MLTFKRLLVNDEFSFNAENDYSYIKLSDHEYQNANSNGIRIMFDPNTRVTIKNQEAWSWDRLRDINLTGTYKLKYGRELVRVENTGLDCGTLPIVRYRPLGEINGYLTILSIWDFTDAYELINDKDLLTQLKDAVIEWDNKTGDAACWYYPEIFNKIAALLGLRLKNNPPGIPKATFDKNCGKFSSEKYNVS